MVPNEKGYRISLALTLWGVSCFFNHVLFMASPTQIGFPISVLKELVNLLPNRFVYVCLKMGYPYINLMVDHHFPISIFHLRCIPNFQTQTICHSAGLNFFYPGKNEAGKLSFASTSVFESSSPFPAILFAKKRRVEFQHLHFSKDPLTFKLGICFFKEFFSLFFDALNLSVFEAGAKLYVTAIACLAYGLAQYNEMVRCTVAHSGNDHRLGAQETGMEGGWEWE